MTTRLIVNADDYGFFPGVSAGIAEGLAAGVVTATGVMANGPAFEAAVARLLALPEADIGVHLNATYGSPLTPDFPALQGVAPGQLPGTRQLAAALLSGRLSAGAVAREWRAQIRRCLSAGLTLRFINSHEHVHMLPFLYSVGVALAREFGIPCLRFTHSEWSPRYGVAGVTRALAMKAFGMFNTAVPGTPRMLGLAPSGHLDLAYLARLLPALRSGGTYELMCHPGHADPAALADAKLHGYHDWKAELDSLMSTSFRSLLARHDVTLTRFRDLH